MFSAVGMRENGARMRALVILSAVITAVPAMAGGEFANPQAVAIVGYQGHAMEPFISRDGRYLLFNNLNDPSENTDLHWAERVTATSFRYGGKIEGVNTGALEGVPTLDRNGTLYFVSTRSYKETLSTIYRAKFDRGRTSGVELVKGLSLMKPGMVNFDVEVSADGQFLYSVDGDLTGGPVPKTADLFVAKRVGDRFERLPDSARIMASVNTSALEYAAAVSSDGLELFFTRMTGALFWRKLTIEHSTRSSADAPFGPSRTITAITGFVEAPTVEGDGKGLYYHQKVDGTHRIFRVSRP
jgi:WD40 repeat protein